SGHASQLFLVRLFDDPAQTPQPASGFVRSRPGALVAARAQPLWRLRLPPSPAQPFVPLDPLPVWSDPLQLLLVPQSPVPPRPVVYAVFLPQLRLSLVPPGQPPPP